MEGKRSLRTVDVTKRRSRMSASNTQFTRFRDAARLHHWSVPTRAGGCWLPPSYFPAQKSELHFLIEPSNIRESAPGCRHRRIDELWNGGCSAIQGRIAGVYSGRWSSLVAGG